jgi:RNA recognition motif. (a.k.a. RRM, RBD, or RNP domain)
MAETLACLQVRFARSHCYIQAGTGPEDNRQLFLARVPPSCSEEEVKALFEQFGQVGCVGGRTGKPM